MKFKKGISIAIVAVLLLLLVWFFAFQGEATEPSTIVVNVPTNHYRIGDKFNITVFCTPKDYLKGWELTMNFNKSIVKALSVYQGNFFGNIPTFFNAGIINNTNGKISELYSVIIGENSIGTPEAFVIIRFEAIQIGVSPLTLTDVGVVNTSGYLTRTITNSSVTIYGSYDMNGDGIINVQDLIDIADHYFEVGVPGWIKEDVVRDGRVDVYDLSKTAEQPGGF